MDRELVHILQRNEIGKMQAYLEGGGDVNRILQGDGPLLSMATSVEMATLLVDKGANIRMRGYLGKTPFPRKRIHSARIYLNIYYHKILIV